MGIFPHIKLEKRKQAYKKTTAKRATKGTCIEQRPLEVFARNTFGHWEMDCVCGPTRPCLLVLSERLTRKELIFKLQSQKAKHVVRVLNVLERRYGKNFRKVFKTITVDNGSEFADTMGMERSSYGKGIRTKIYYCHPYCSILDLYFRKVIAHRIALNNSTQLVKNTFKDAYETRQPKGTLIFHSNRGGNYRSKTFCNYLKYLKVTQSFSRAYTPYDNSVVESFFSSLKREELYRTKYRSDKEFKKAADEYMVFYNSQRPHSNNNYRTPDAKEAEYYSKNST